MPALSTLLVAVITGSIGLLGVVIGAWLTGRNQKRERQIRFYREQLAELYGPLLALRKKVLAESELRKKITEQAGAAWTERSEQAAAVGVEEMQRASKVEFPHYGEVLTYEQRRFVEELLPLYQR